MAVVGALDWSPFFGIDYSTGFNQKQLIGIGSVTFVKGIIDEVARRRKGETTL